MSQVQSSVLVRRYESLAFRVLAKLSALLSAVRTYWAAPLHFRSADIHLLFQSEAQIQAQKTVVEPWQYSHTQLDVLVIIPFRDKWEMTSRCVESILRQRPSIHRFHLALVDNGSREALTANGIQELLKKNVPGFTFRHLRYDTPFNFSDLNNWAVRDCAELKPDIVFLCNNDVEFSDSDSIVSLAEFCEYQPNAGAVGCTLVYPNQTIQHLFIYVGSKIVGAHPFRGKKLDLQQEWYASARPVGAVTGAVTLVKYKVFQDSGGFDPLLSTSYQDVDLCLKFQKMGLVNWVVPRVVAIHYEGQTRGKAPSWGEAEYIYKKWGSQLTANRFVHPDLNRCSENFLMRVL